MKPTGLTLISVLVASVILAIGVLIFAQVEGLGRKKTLELEQTALAEFYGGELLELFRSHTQASFQSFLRNSSNPDRRDFLYCSHMNLLDRTNNKILNPDTVADLPPSLLDGGAPTTRANRYYQVFIVNAADDLLYDNNVCNKKYRNDAPTATQRYLVTVGVSWIPKGKTAQNAKRVVLTTLIPG